ncbi:MAG TPA: ParB/RepB/Spo0J family partition protein, partial [Tepidisphaeraceae bacterium]|nr:ParB/RepB/Spo0J family partition protein [Tepidisphaeraceae bacterium]
MSTATTAPRASERRHALPQLPPDDAAPAAPARQKFVKLDDDVADVLRGASCSGANLKLGGQLDRKLYQRTMKVLEQLGGDWNRKLQCHVFPSEAKPLIDAALGDGKVLNRQQSYQFFETPPDVAMRVAQLAAIGPGMTVLEPSAGRGAIATAVFAAQPLADLYMVEIDPTHRDALDGIAGEEAVRIGDFLALPADALVPDPSGFDRVVMNPPFSGGQDADHVLRAFSLLKPGGRLVAIVGTGILSRTDKRAVAFQDFLAEHAAAAEDHELPAGTFADTDVATRIVVIDKPTAARAAVAPGEPADAQVHADDAATEAAPPPPETPPADWFQEIPLDRIHESKTNPRKSFRGLEELAASISQKGVIQPVLVRPTGETTGGRVVFKPTAETLANAPGLRDSMTFELVAGARRYRASQLAGAATIPAMVRILDDKSVEEIQTIENDQREDVRPLEQAEGYQRLIEHHGYDVAALA